MSNGGIFVVINVKNVQEKTFLEEGNMCIRFCLKSFWKNRLQLEVTEFLNPTI